MKDIEKRLDVDIIGGLGELTNEESKFLSDYFAKQKDETSDINGEKLSTKESLKTNKLPSTE